MIDDTMTLLPLTIRCGGWCPHTETGPDPYDVASRILAHWRTAHLDLIEAPFLTRCPRPGCGRLCWGSYCCEMCMASDDGGAPLGPWTPGAAAVAVHQRDCEDRARRRNPAWYADSARPGR
jgi:hypothetical protein